MEWTDPFRYEELDVWRLGMEILDDVYRVTAKYPSHEQYTLVSQTIRAALSIPLNIAEGTGRGSRVELRRFSRMSRGSCTEVSVCLEVALRRKYVSPQEQSEIREKIRREYFMLVKFEKSLAAQIQSDAQLPASPRNSPHLHATNS